MNDALPSFSPPPGPCRDCGTTTHTKLSGDRKTYICAFGCPPDVCPHHTYLDGECDSCGKPEFDVVIKMPHVPMQTAQMVADKLGLRPRQRRIIGFAAEARGLPPGRLHVIEARGIYTGPRDWDMFETLQPYESDDRYEVIWHDCDTVMGVKR